MGYNFSYNYDADGTHVPTKKFRWAVTVKRTNGAIEVGFYNAQHGIPITADHVKNSPAVKDWISTDELVEIA